MLVVNNIMPKSVIMLSNVKIVSRIFCEVDISMAYLYILIRRYLLDIFKEFSTNSIVEVFIKWHPVDHINEDTVEPPLAINWLKSNG